ncbi:MAG: hypothetical protein GX037_06930 [Trueperella sp.]|nr:hypothetical protein [Trueperella sp.]
MRVSIPDGGRGGIPMDNGTFSFDILTDPATIWGADAMAAAEAAGVELPGGYLNTTNDSPHGYESSLSSLTAPSTSFKYGSTHRQLQEPSRGGPSRQ